MLRIYAMWPFSVASRAYMPPEPAGVCMHSRNAASVSLCEQVSLLVRSAVVIVGGLLLFMCCVNHASCLCWKIHNPVLVDMHGSVRSLQVSSL